MAANYATKCKKLGAKILKQTWARGWSQRRLAREFADQSVSTVNRWTNDPDSALAQAGRTLLQLSDLLNCSVDYLIRDEVEDPLGGLLTPQQRYLLDLAQRVGMDEAIDRIVMNPARVDGVQARNVGPEPGSPDDPKAAGKGRGKRNG